MTGGVKPDLVMKLPQLQNLIKRDPSAYKEEFKQQFRSYQAEFKLFTLKPSRDAPRFEELVNFMSHVAPCYPQECGDLPDQLMQLLDESATVMTPRVRKTIVQALILMRNRGLVDVPALLRLIFKLFRCQDKALREMLYEYVVTDIRNVNQKAKNDKLNRELQAFMYVMLKDEHSIAAKRSLEAMVELYRRRVWTDARTVNVIASACLSQAVRLMVIATNFFLGIEQKMADDEDEEVAKAEKIEVDFHEHSKKTKARARDTRKQLKKRKALAKKAQQEKEGEKTAPQPLFPAIQMLHDPQGLADKLFKRLRTCTERFEVKLLLMNFLSRLIGHHKLLVLNFYSFVQRYLNSHQKDVTVILAYLVQACHDLVPPGELLPVVKNVANAFVADRCSSEVIAVGINALREVMVRTPSLLYEDGMDGFVQDISAYCRTKDKSVMMAARTFLNTVRELYPGLLQARHRGKNHIKGAQPSQYGEMKVAEGVEGAELLQALEEGRLTLSDSEEEGEEEDEDEEGWVDMEGDDEDEEGEEEEGEEMEVGSGDEGEEEEEEEEEESDDGEEEEEEEELGSDQEGWVNMSDDEEEGEEEEEEEEEDEDDDEEEGEEGEEERPSPTVGSKRSRIEAMRERRALRKAMKDPLYEPPSTAKDVIEETVKVKDQKSRIDAQRILTEEDFEKIKKLKAKVEAMKRDPKRIKGGNKDEEISDGEIEIEDDDAPKGWLSSSVVRPEDLEGFVKKKRASKEERLMRIVSGKKDFEHTGHAGGLTNLEKQRRKSYLMVRKGKRSVFSKLRDTQQEQKARKVKGVKSKFKREARKRRRV